MTVLSLLTLNRIVPEPMKLSACTLALWPVKMVRRLPLCVSHMRTVLSSLPLASRNASGEKHRLVTSSACPFRVCRFSTWSRPDASDQRQRHGGCRGACPKRLCR